MEKAERSAIFEYHNRELLAERKKLKEDISRLTKVPKNIEFKELQRNYNELSEKYSRLEKINRFQLHELGNAAGPAHLAWQILKDSKLLKKLPKKDRKKYENMLTNSLRRNGAIIRGELFATKGVDSSSYSVDLQNIKEVVGDSADIAYNAVDYVDNLKVKIKNKVPNFTFSFDRNKVETILMNIIKNAVVNADKNTIVETSGTKLLSDYRIGVHNYGPAIPDDQKKLVFQYGERLDPEKYQGMGVGLHQCKDLAHLVGGDISFESGKKNDREYVEFFLTLPMHPHLTH